MALAYSRFDDDTRNEAHAEYLESIGPYRNGSGYEIPGEFVDLIEGYLSSVLGSSAEHRGWKIPETTLVFPWIARLYPECKYIYWIRDPRDSIIGAHLTDDLA